MNLTKSKITINSIIEFIHNAMHYNMYISEEFYDFKEDDKEWCFCINNNKDYIRYIVKNRPEGDSIIVECHTGSLIINISLSERDIIDLNTLSLDIKEYGEDAALNTLNNFFSNIEDRPTNIDDLDED